MTTSNPNDLAGTIAVLTAHDAHERARTHAADIACGWVGPQWAAAIADHDAVGILHSRLIACGLTEADATVLAIGA